MGMEYEANMDGFMDYVLNLFPEAEVSEDEDGQLVINTGLHQAPNGLIVALPKV